MESLIIPDEQGALIIFDPCPVEIMWYPQPVKTSPGFRGNMDQERPVRPVNDTKKIRPIDVEWDRYTMIYPSHLCYVYYIIYIYIIYIYVQYIYIYIHNIYIYIYMVYPWYIQVLDILRPGGSSAIWMAQLVGRSAWFLAPPGRRRGTKWGSWVGFMMGNIMGIYYMVDTYRNWNNGIIMLLGYIYIYVVL